MMIGPLVATAPTLITETMLPSRLLSSQRLVMCPWTSQSARPGWQILERGFYIHAIGYYLSSRICITSSILDTVITCDDNLSHRVVQCRDNARVELLNLLPRLYSVSCSLARLIVDNACPGSPAGQHVLAGVVSPQDPATVALWCLSIPGSL